MAQKILNKSNTIYKFHSKISGTNPGAKKELIQLYKLQEILKAIEGLNLNIEICGSWIWIFGAVRSDEAQLKAANFNWSYQKGGWYWCPGSSKPHKHGRSYSMEKIREKYGSQFVQV